MRRPLVVFIGGGIGACLRALLLVWLAPWSAIFPLAVLVANLLGAFMLGIVFVLADEAGVMRIETRLFLAVGVLGGFTTFSTFGWGVDLLLAQPARWGIGLAYLAASVAGGIVAVGVGVVAGREAAALERAARTLLRRLDEREPRRAGKPREVIASAEAENCEESA